MSFHAIFCFPLERSRWINVKLPRFFRYGLRIRRIGQNLFKSIVIVAAICKVL